MAQNTASERYMITMSCRISETQEAIMKKEGIISYRRRCRQIGTGLSHFILLVSKTGKK